jgi:uncharacterized membrane protein YdbT with pleckstrin-like domain
MIAPPLFPGQKPDEQVKLLVRPHWLVMLRPLAAILFLAIIPVVVLAVLSANQVEPFSGIGLAITAVTVPAYYLTLITWFFIAWVDYYLDVGIITDHRIIDIDQRGLFRRNVAELDCKMVQDINADKTGILQTLFNFGDVIVQTAGETPNFTFTAIPRPDEMVDRIQEVIRALGSKDEGAAQKLEQAAAKMGEAAEKISGDHPTQPEPQGPAAPQPQSDQTPHDLPRQYER